MQRSRLIHTTPFVRQDEATAAAAEDVETGDGDGSITRFQQLEDQNIVHRNIVRTITRDMGLETLTEVQSSTINTALKGTDIIAQAKTGTGKTLAFLLPILQRVLDADPRLAERGNRGPRGPDIRGIVISPTRELAEQIAEEAKKLVKGTGLIVRTAVGGTQKSSGLRLIQQGCHLLVATPGRLKDIMTDSYSAVEAPKLDALVFDEADRLLDQGFWPEIQEIMRLLPTPAERDRQTMMFSATVPREVVNLVRSTLKPGFSFVKCVRDDEEPTHTRVPQRLVVVKAFENSTPALVELCDRAIEASKAPGARPFKAIVYFNSTAEVSLAAATLQHLRSSNEGNRDAFGQIRSRHPWSPTLVYEIHARLSQAQRTRTADGFRHCKSGILLSSDVTARGLDFPDVTHVIQVGLAGSRDQYIHRVGRTARAGKEGESWLIVSELERDETEQRLYKLPLRPDHSLGSATCDLTDTDGLPSEVAKPLGMYSAGIRSVSLKEKVAVYKALLGVFGWARSKRELVESMNRLATNGWGLEQPPMLPYGLVQKLRLDRIPGIRIGEDDTVDEDRFASGGRRPYGSQGRQFGGRRDGSSRPGGFRSKFDSRAPYDRQGGDRYGRRRDDRDRGSRSSPFE